MYAAFEMGHHLCEGGGRIIYIFNLCITFINKDTKKPVMLFVPKENWGLEEKRERKTLHCSHFDTLAF